MTTEEKAKAYDKAKARISKAYNDNRCSIGFMNEIFPELNTEDDVRRRSTIQVLEYARSLDTYNQYGKADIDKNIAWLEKQGENISLPKFTFDDVLALQCAMEAAKKVQKDKDLYEQLESLHDRLHDAYWLEKQGEQKLDGTFVNVDDVREDFVNEVYRVLDADPNNDRANQIIDAFDNLPTVTIEKQSKQKPSEWSEEDETRLINIIIMLKEGASHHFIKDDITKAVDWLKSLRPQKQWKPSEEQIKACKEVYSDLLSAKGNDYDMSWHKSYCKQLEEVCTDALRKTK